MFVESLGEGGGSAARRRAKGSVPKVRFPWHGAGCEDEAGNIPALSQLRGCCSELLHFPLAAAEDHGETFPKGIKYYKKMLFQSRC